MRFGLSLEPQAWPRAGGDAMLRAARDAERIGLDYVLMSNHVLENPHGAGHDPVVLLAAIAGATTHIGIATSVLVLPYYRPVVLANQIATLDVMSAGRLVVAVGTGWNPQEFDALGVPIRLRGQRTDECLEIMKALWSGTTGGLDARFAGLRDAIIGVPPHRPGGPPIWVGGHSDAAIRRALRFGDGWHGSGINHEEARFFRRRIEELADGTGRDPATIEINTVGFLVPRGIPAVRPVPGRLLGGTDATTEAIVEDLRQLADAGVTMCSLWMPIDGRLVGEALEWLASEVLPHVEPTSWSGPRHRV
ncbi:TIGR03619 family F420-dependent LLM class oxidoreductase [Micromonospora sp. NPDC049230]|uniref:TIGR03619 family F420-dependent LLM class oxidoreductase n=1 Tax=Micromonospora sp. NPDC049230 TaxID=3155502 RepID=UPI0033D6FB31